MRLLISEVFSLLVESEPLTYFSCVHPDRSPVLHFIGYILCTVRWYLFKAFHRKLKLFSFHIENVLWKLIMFVSFPFNSYKFVLYRFIPVENHRSQWFPSFLELLSRLRKLQIFFFYGKLKVSCLVRMRAQTSWRKFLFDDFLRLIFMAPVNSAGRSITELSVFHRQAAVGII